MTLYSKWRVSRISNLLLGQNPSDSKERQEFVIRNKLTIRLSNAI